MEIPQIESGSFRDRTSRVFYLNGRVCRYLNAAAAQAWETLAKSQFFPRVVSEGKVVETRLVQDVPLGPPWVAALEHARLPFISYPYEWSFSMLKEAALLQLDLLVAALGEDMVLRDCSSFNVQWVGTRPVFIDIPSFAAWTPGEPWVGYKQFCQMFLFPLMLQAYKGLPFQRWLRGHLEGLPAQETAQLFSWWDIRRPGVLADVFLQNLFEKRMSGSKVRVRQEMQSAGFSKELIFGNLRRLQKITASLHWDLPGSQWSEYTRQCHYAATDYEEKKAFVRRVTETRRRGLVWDLGCNTGQFSRLASERADLVVAMDADPWVVENLFLELRKEKDERILPLCMDVSDASPGQGWRGQERKALTDRRRPDLVLALAVIHHIVITGHVPLPEVVEWFASLGAEAVLEFVRREDPMVQRLLLNKEDIYDEYTQPNFEDLIGRHFDVRMRQVLAGGNRTLYHVVPRSAS